MAGEDEAYLAWIRHQRCCVEFCPAKDIEAHHDPFRKGMGQRNHDHTAIPLCRRHHRQFHDVSGHFKGWLKEDRKLFMRERATGMLTLYFGRPVETSFDVSDDIERGDIF